MNKSLFILDQGFNSSLNRLRHEAANIIKDIAKEKNYAAVLNQDTVIISIPSLDITDEVVARMNKSVKKMAVDWTVPQDQAAAPHDGKKK